VTRHGVTGDDLIMALPVCIAAVAWDAVGPAQSASRITITETLEHE